MDRLKILLVAAFLTESFRLLPVPLSDIQRSLLLAISVSSLGARSLWRVKVGFLLAARPFFLAMALTVVVDAILGRFGFYSFVFWVKLAAVSLVGSVVFTLSARQMRTLLLLVLGLLCVQYVFFVRSPEYFASVGRSLGIEDPLTLYGADLERVYYAYFQANAAAYSIYFAFLSWISIATFNGERPFLKWAVAATFLALSFATGGRGVILLSLPFLLGHLLSLRSTAGLAFFVVLPAIVVAGVSLYDATLELIFLREESNEARQYAMMSYMESLRSNPLVGEGYEILRNRVAAGEKPSHVLFLEVLAAHGVVLGGGILLSMMVPLIRNPGVIWLRQVGLFAIAAGLFSNAILLMPTFIALLFPVVLKISRDIDGGLYSGR